MNAYECLGLEPMPLASTLVSSVPALTRTIDGAQARFLRRILNVPTAYISRISQREIRRRCSSRFRFSIIIFRSQLRFLGHIFRKPPTHPFRLVTFQHNTDLDPAALQLTAVLRLSYAVDPVLIGDRKFYVKCTASAVRPAERGWLLRKIGKDDTKRADFFRPSNYWPKISACFSV